MAQKQNQRRFLARYPIADTWPQFFGRMALVVFAAGLIAAAFIAAR